LSTEIQNSTSGETAQEESTTASLKKVACETIIGLGYNLIPGNYKTPLGKWKRWQTERISKGQYKEWLLNPWQISPVNWFFLTGTKPYNDALPLIALDADDEEAARLVEECCPATRLKTIRGESGREHYLYRRPDKPDYIKQRTKTTIDGVTYNLDLKADHNYVVAPGSQHSTGDLYRWCEPWTQELILATPVYDPLWLPLDPNSNNDDPNNGDVTDNIEHTEAIANVSTPLADRLAEAREWADRQPGCQAGMGNGAASYCFKLAMRLLWGFALPAESAVKVLHDWGQRADQTDEHGTYYPWTWGEIQHKINGALVKRYTDGVGHLLEDEGLDYSALNVITPFEAATTTPQNNGKPKPKPKPKVKKPTQAKRILALANANVAFFTTADNVPWVTVRQKGHSEHWGLRDPKFRRFLTTLYYAKEGDAPTDRALKSALEILEYKARAADVERVYQRVARLSNKIVVDLGNDAWQAVEVTADGWEVVDNPCVKFRRTQNTGELPLPTRGGSFDDLRPLLATDDHNFALFRGAVLDAYKGRGPFMAMIVTGEQGSAKSWACRFYRMVVDPLRKAPLSSLPREEKDLGVDGVNEYLLVYDNVSYLPQWLSDALCRVCTGGGIKSRALYTDNTQSVFDICNPVCLNGIPDFAESNDLLGRAVIIRQPYIPENQRIDEETLMSRFDEIKANVFGGILDDLANGLRNIQTTNVPKLPRMADSAKWVTACLGNDTFLAAYRENIAEAIEIGVEASPIAGLIKKMLVATDGTMPGKWEGTASELLDRVRALAFNEGGDLPNLKNFPQRPNALTNRLRRDAPALRAIGINIEFGRSKRKRLITLSMG
jgi:hypothetical protein